MQEDSISQSIMALTTPEQWEAGKVLFDSDGVLDAQYTAKAVDARVANESFTFERVSVVFRANQLACKCTCSHSSQYCKHIVALLLYIAKETPELLNCLPSLEGKGSTGEDQTPMHFQGSSVSIEAIRDFLSAQEQQATLQLKCGTELPQLTLVRQRLTLQANLFCHDNVYAQGNIKKLVENGLAAGNMSLSDFDPQTQQVMRFLVQFASFDQKELSLDSEAAADLFHCLRGSSILSTPSGVVQFHHDTLQIQFSVTAKDARQATVVPRIVASDKGVLSNDRLSFVAGRAGYWIGRNLEYWWFPGIIPFNWLRMFINGQHITLSSPELARLSQLCDSKRFPGRVKLARPAMQLGVDAGKARPVLSLDWDENGLIGDLQFDYKGKRIEDDSEVVIWANDSFIRRDLDAENAAKKLLKDAGFHQTDESWRRIRLEDKKDIWQFIQITSPALTPNWLIFWTPQVRLNTLATADASLTIQAGQEGNGWFEAACDLKAADGTPIPFPLALEAIKNGDDFIRLPGGAVARLPEELSVLVNKLITRATERRENTFNLKKCHAVALVDDMIPFWSGKRPDWHSLKSRLTHTETQELPPLPGKLFTTLRDYQKEGVKWLSILEDCGFHGILADEMGLGKTVQALAALSARKITGNANGPSLVVCPTSLLENWRAEADKFTPELKAITITGTDRAKLFRQIHNFDIAITSYALLRRDSLEYSDIEFDYVILDEAQHIKNPKTANALACKDLKSNHRLVLTGTPMENSPSEIWSLFDFLQSGYLGTQRDFKQTYQAKHDDAKQAQMASRLASIIRPFVLRRTKAEVCAELPNKLEQDMFCEMGDEQRKLYDGLLLASRTYLDELHASGLKWSERRMEILSMILRLRQACCHPGLLPAEYLENYPADIPSVKLDLAKEVILEAIDSGHRILFFSQFTSILKLFPEWLKKSHIKFESIDGSTTDRQSKVDKFNKDSSIPVFLLSLKAGGVGLNLPGADTVIHFDQWWNPMVEDQATDRSHRIGQTRTVTSIRLVTRNTIEEKILRLQDSKRDLFRKVLGEAPAALKDITQEDIEFLLK